MVSLVFGNIVATVLIALSFILPVATPLAVLMFILGVLSLAILINREQIWAKYILDCEVFIGNENPEPRVEEEIPVEEVPPLRIVRNV